MSRAPWRFGLLHFYCVPVWSWGRPHPAFLETPALPPTGAQMGNWARWPAGGRRWEWTENSSGSDRECGCQLHTPLRLPESLCPGWETADGSPVNRGLRCLGCEGGSDGPSSPSGYRGEARGLLHADGLARVSPTSLSLIFGLITCLTGVLGVGLGVEISRRLRRYNPRADPLVCAAGLLGSAPFLFLSVACARGSIVATYVSSQ